MFVGRCRACARRRPPRLFDIRKAPSERHDSLEHRFDRLSRVSLLNEHIDVRSTDSGDPAQFIWRGRTFRVRRIIGDWRPDHPGATEKAHLLRVSAESDTGEPSIVDIAKDAGSECWTVRREWH